MSQETARKTVLIVDDVPSNVKIMNSLLKDHYRTMMATTGERVLDLINLGRLPDLILLDIGLPDLDGYGVCAAIKAIPEACDIPIIFLTGKAAPEDELKGLEMGAVDYLTKPISAPLLLARVRTHLALTDANRSLREQNLSLERIVHERTCELLETKERVLQVQKMEAMGRLAGGVAHDFNNILSVILSYSELALQGLTSEHPVREDIQEILKAGQMAAGLTRQLLIFSRRQSLETRILDLNSLIAGMRGMLRRLLGDDVELRVDLFPELAPVQADRGQIEQAIMNLIINARDAMPVGGTITVSSQNADLEIPNGQGCQPYTIVSVADSGVGMDAETQKRIFEPFFTTKQFGKGTGLGLATVLGIVQGVGGHVTVSSDFGRGSCFSLCIPSKPDGALEASDDTPSENLQIGWERVLVVEDQEQLRNLVSGVLRRLGYRVLEATNGKQALALLQEHPTDVQLLLTDVVLPGMSGKQLADTLTSERPEMRTLFMTGSCDEALEHYGVVESGAPILRKPLTPSSLARKVREVLDSKSSAARETALPVGT